jgi:hypothetical protein
MVIRLTSLVLLGALLAGIAVGQSPANLRVSELKKHPFEVGQLKITIEKLHGSILGNPGYMLVRIDNSTDTALEFNPGVLYFVNKDNEQVNVSSVSSSSVFDSTRPSQALPRIVAPGAHLRESYRLERKARLPIRLFYEKTELAVISE